MKVEIKRYCPKCKLDQRCRIIANDMMGSPTVTICHTCGMRVN